MGHKQQIHYLLVDSNLLEECSEILEKEWALYFPSLVLSSMWSLHHNPIGLFPIHTWPPSGNSIHASLGVSQNTPRRLPHTNTSGFWSSHLLPLVLDMHARLLLQDYPLVPTWHHAHAYTQSSILYWVTLPNSSIAVQWLMSLFTWSLALFTPSHTLTFSHKTQLVAFVFSFFSFSFTYNI